MSRPRCRTSSPSATPSRDITVVCEDWGAELPPSTIDCGAAVALALAAVGGERAASVRRLDFSFGDGCAPDGTCRDRRPDAGWVVARAATFETLGVRVLLDPSGELRAWPPVPGPVLPPPPFAPPSGVTADLGPGLPAGLRRRTVVPSCGDEDLTSPDDFATKARSCFLGGSSPACPRS